MSYQKIAKVADRIVKVQISMLTLFTIKGKVVITGIVRPVLLT